MMVIVKKCSFAEIEGDGNFPALALEYAAESAIHGLPPAGEKFAAYRALDASGVFHAFGAFLGDKLVGFIALLLPVLPHYGVTIGVTESFFVAAEHRKSGAGIKLLRAAEQHAHGAGSPGVFASSPVGGVLADVLPGLGYKETNRVFLKLFAHA